MSILGLDHDTERLEMIRSPPRQKRLPCDDGREIICQLGRQAHLILILTSDIILNIPSMMLDVISSVSLKSSALSHRCQGKMLSSPDAKPAQQPDIFKHVN